MTPLRWRRRMRWISSSAGSSMAIPGDLRIRPPYVVGPQVVHAVELLAFEPRDGELHERRRGGKRVRRRCDLDVAAGLLKLPTVHERAPAHQDGVLGPGLELRGELGGRADQEV